MEFLEHVSKFNLQQLYCNAVFTYKKDSVIYLTLVKHKNLVGPKVVSEKSWNETDNHVSKLK